MPSLGYGVAGSVPHNRVVFVSFSQNSNSARGSACR